MATADERIEHLTERLHRWEARIDAEQKEVARLKAVVTDAVHAINEQLEGMTQRDSALAELRRSGKELSAVVREVLPPG